MLGQLGNWCLPVLFRLCSEAYSISTDFEKLARSLNRAFTACLTDRSADNVSKRMGTMYIANLIFKVNSKLNQSSASIVKAMSASDLPKLYKFPKSHQVTFSYYTGLMQFLEGKYESSEAKFNFALENCLHSETNLKKILLFLIPLKMLNGILPCQSLLDRFDLQLYSQLISTIRIGDLHNFNRLLDCNESELLKIQTFSIFEKMIFLCQRNFVKRVFLLLNKETKIALKFLAFGSDLDSVECMLANLISFGFIRGYLSHERSFLVLSAKEPFPKNFKLAFNNALQ